MLTDVFTLLLTHLAVGFDLPLGGWLGAADSSAASGEPMQCEFGVTVRTCAKISICCDELVGRFFERSTAATQVDT